MSASCMLRPKTAGPLAAPKLPGRNAPRNGLPRSQYEIRKQTFAAARYFPWRRLVMPRVIRRLALALRASVPASPALEQFNGGAGPAARSQICCLGGTRDTVTSRHSSRGSQMKRPGLQV